MSHPQPRRHETGFPEPFSADRNTTLPHPEGAARPSEELPATAIEHKHRYRLLHRYRKADKVEEDMYAGLNVHNNPDNSDVVPEQEEERRWRKDGKIKKALHKISCGSF